MNLIIMLTNLKIKYNENVNTRIVYLSNLIFHF